MRRVETLLVIFILAIASASIDRGVVLAQEPVQSQKVPSVVQPATMTTELALRVQVQQLTEQLHNAEVGFAQCNARASDLQAKLDSSVLTTQAADLNEKHAKLDAEIKKALGAKSDDTVDWTTSPPTLKKIKT